MRFLAVQIAVVLVSASCSERGATREAQSTRGGVGASSGSADTAESRRETPNAGSVSVRDAAGTNAATTGATAGGAPSAGGMSAEQHARGDGDMGPVPGGTGPMSTDTQGSAGMGTAASAGAQGSKDAPSRPKDGDPNQPIVTVDGLPCGGTQSGTQRIGGRAVTVDYPCNKHEGAQVTVILNLHGTLIGGASYLYQHAYFSVHKLVDSHNLIVLTPESVSKASLGAQWGNMDNGEDVPHLLAAIDWAYSAFAKFQIRGLWLGGHSWGARFISGSEHPVGEPFACNAKLADKVKGVVGMSHLRMPTCASRLAMISTRGAEEEIPLLDQSAVATEHGCMTPATGPEMLGNNKYLHFAGCKTGFVHEDYEMLGKGHIDNIDAEIVEHIADAILSTQIP